MLIGIVLEEHYIEFYYLTINELFDKVVRLDNWWDSSFRFAMKVNAWKGKWVGEVLHNLNTISQMWGSVK